MKRIVLALLAATMLAATTGCCGGPPSPSGCRGTPGCGYLYPTSNCYGPIPYTNGKRINTVKPND